ncbi:unnamed protein product [Notodromas monacha]|uniref:Uncharacterized protein n=1 Tax=Notodromas monacha TaxID=399045 RepID=A0A7R9BW20_9CRUS|nr:unnamed protein product [Notodromas monacha]CAG0921283.1 unnamed protein product [Notodromas monacha]
MEDDRKVGNKSKPEAKAIYLELISFLTHGPKFGYHPYQPSPANMGYSSTEPVPAYFKLRGLGSVQDHQMPLGFWQEFPRVVVNNENDAFYKRPHYEVLNRLRDWGFELQSFTQHFYDRKPLRGSRSEHLYYVLCRYPSTSTSASSAHQTDIQDVTVEVSANEQEDASSLNSSGPTVVPSPIMNAPEDPSSAQENIAEKPVPEVPSDGVPAKSVVSETIKPGVTFSSCNFFLGTHPSYPKP